MSLSTRLAERGITVNGRTPADVLAAEASRIAQEARALGRAVADTTDVPACVPAHEAAVRLEGLADVLEASDGPTHEEDTDGRLDNRERREPETPAQMAERTRREQGLPPKIQDPVAQRKIAVLMTGGRRQDVAKDGVQTSTPKDAP